MTPLRAGLVVVCVLAGAACAPESFLFDADLHRVVNCMTAPEGVDFGTVTSGETRTVGLRVSNPGSQPELLRLETEEPFSFPESQVLLPVGGSVSVPVQFEPPDGREWVGEARLRFATCEPVTARLAGRGRNAPFRVSTSFLEFGPLAPGASHTRPLFLFSQSTVRVPVQLRGNFVTQPTDAGRPSEASVFTLPLDEVELSPMQVVEVPITFHAGDAGVFEQALTLSAVAQSEILSLRGVSGLPRLEFEPTAFSLPHLPLAMTTDLQVNFRNVGEGVALVRSAQVLTSGGTPATEASVAIFNGNAMVSVALFPTSTGPRHWVLELTTNEVGQSPVRIPIDAEVRTLPSCGMGAITPPLDVQTFGPFPRTVALEFVNRSGSTCVVNELQFITFSTSRLSARQLLVAPGSSATLDVTIVEPRRDSLLYDVVGPEGTRLVNIVSTP